MVVCGLGPVGIATAIRMHDQGHSVVAIERDATCPRIRTARAHGVRVVVGEATSAGVRAHAAIARAGWFVWTPSEWIEGEAVAAELRADLRNARSQRHRSGGDENAAPSALIRVHDLALCSVFRRDGLAQASGADVDLDTDFFNEAENTAQRLLWKTTRGFATADGAPVEIWILGVGPFAEALVVQAVRNWWGSEARPQLVIRVFDEGAAAAAAHIAARWPEVAMVDVLRPEPVAPETALTRALGPQAAPDGIFVLVDDEERALHLGLRLVEEVDDIPIAIAATHRYPPAASDPQREFFDSVQFGLESDAFMFDTFELLGRMIHQHSVLRHRLRPDNSLELDDDPNGPGHEWNDLQPFWQESSRAAPRAIVPTLQSIGFEITRLGTRGSTPATCTTFSADQLERMAEREHERWRSFLTDHGWTLGPQRDNTARIHPRLMSWDEAPEHDREGTREQVADYPRLLAFLGFAVIAPSGGPTAG